MSHTPQNVEPLDTPDKEEWVTSLQREMTDDAIHLDIEVINPSMFSGVVKTSEEE